MRIRSPYRDAEIPLPSSSLSVHTSLYPILPLLLLPIRTFLNIPTRNGEIISSRFPVFSFALSLYPSLLAILVLPAARLARNSRKIHENHDSVDNFDPSFSLSFVRIFNYRLVHRLLHLNFLPPLSGRNGLLHGRKHHCRSGSHLFVCPLFFRVFLLFLSILSRLFKINHQVIIYRLKNT